MYQNRRKKELGQALVEMAVSFPVLILILSGILDFGRVYFTFIALEEAAAEAALFLAINPECPDSTDPDSMNDGLNYCADPNNALFRASTATNREFDAANAEWNIPFGADAIAAGFRDPFYTCGGRPAIGCLVIIQVRYPFEFITPGMQAISESISAGEGLVLVVQATQTILYE